MHLPDYPNQVGALPALPQQVVMIVQNHPVLQVPLEIGEGVLHTLQQPLFQVGRTQQWLLAIDGAGNEIGAVVQKQVGGIVTIFF